MPAPVRLHTERLILRPWQAGDREPFAELSADPEVMEFFPGLHTRAESDAVAARFDQHFVDHGYGLWIVQDSVRGPVLGFVGLYHTTFEASFTPCVEIAWRLARTVWGRGYATEAACASLHFAFENLALPEVVAYTVPVNRRSRAVMEKIGMRHAPGDDFQHPRLPEGHPLREHILYRLGKEAWKQLSKEVPPPRVC